MNSTSSAKASRVLLPEHPVNPSELHIGAGTLYDVVVLAGGSDAKISPLCDDIPKAMLPLCGRPLIWHCLRHWIDNGVRTLFLCLHEYDRSAVEVYLREAFPKVTMHIVIVKPNVKKATPTTSCHALAAYRDYKRNELRGTPAGTPREVLVVSGDTILTKVDLQPFFLNFYANHASVAVLLWRVAQRLDEAGAAEAASGGGGGSRGKGKKQQEQLELKKYKEELCSVIAEPDEIPGSGASSSTGKGFSPSNPTMEHYRMHYLEHSTEEAKVSVGFAARRPNLIAFADVSDSYIYLLRASVLDYIIDESKSVPSLLLDADLIPTLARSQHALINKERNKFMTPNEKLGVDNFTIHWAEESLTPKSIGFLNAVQPFSSPAVLHDTLKVVCTVLNERPEAPANAPRTSWAPSIRRVSTTDAFIAVTQEMLSAFIGAAAAATAEGHHLLDTTCFANNPSLFPYGTSGVSLLDEAAMAHYGANPSHRVVESLVFSPTHDTSYIRRSVIGKGVTFGKDCRVTNSIILDHVELGDKTIISNAVIAAGAEIQAKQEVSATIVAPRTIVGSDESESKK